MSSIVASDRLALLIDGDNASSDDLPKIMQEAAALGIISFKRVYGDFTNPALHKNWSKDICAEYAPAT